MCMCENKKWHHMIYTMATTIIDYHEYEYEHENDENDDDDDDDDWHWLPVMYWLCEAPVLSFHVSRASIVVAGGSRVGGALGMAGGRAEGPSASHARGGAAEQAGDSGAEAAMVDLV